MADIFDEIDAAPVRDIFDEVEEPPAPAVAPAPVKWRGVNAEYPKGSVGIGRVLDNEEVGRTAFEAVGMVGGGGLGSFVAPGPGTIAGEIVGGLAGRKFGDAVYGPREDATLLGDIGTMSAYAVLPRGAATALKATGRAIPPSIADKLYRSAAKIETVLKPDAVRKALDAAYRTRSTVSTTGQSNLQRSISGHLSFIDDALAKNGGKFIDKQDVVKRIDDLAVDFIDMPVARPYLEELGRIRAQFIAEKPDKIPVAQAQRIKRKAWAELHAFFKKHNRLNASRETIVGEQANLKIGQALREGLEKEVPEIAGANKALGGELELQTAIDRAVGRISNKDIVSIMDPLVMEAFTKETWGPGIKAMVARKLLEWPRFKSYLAIEIANAGKRPLLKARPGATAALPIIGGLFTDYQ